MSGHGFWDSDMPCAALQVTPEIIRELDHSRNRGEKGDAPSSMEVQSLVGQHAAEDPNDMPPVLMMEED
eukprot:scaffold591418_cov42-Prasinocladus_malaysianus.AAC.1